MLNPTGLETGRELKDSGQEATLEAEHEEWKTAVWDFVRRLPPGHEFTTHSLQERINDPHHPNCWGAAMSRLAKLGVIKGTRRYVNSTRPSCHAAIIQIWRKL